jgi:hypothetical protein
VWIYLALYNSMAGTSGFGTSSGSGSRRQEVLVGLVGHISSPVQKEVDSGLCILSSLAHAEHVKALQDIHRCCHPPPSSFSSSLTMRQQHQQGGGTSCFTSSSSSLRVFLPFIKSLLEDVRSLKEHQQRVIFRYHNIYIYIYIYMPSLYFPHISS